MAVLSSGPIGGSFTSLEYASTATVLIALAILWIAWSWYKKNKK